MKKLNTSVFVVILCCLYANSSFAQEMPKVQKDLQRFTGNWECKDTKMMMGGKTYSVDYHFNGKSAIEGSGLVADEYFDHPELGKMRGLNIVNYDPTTQQIHWYTIDNFGTCHDHLCNWTDKDHFYFQYQGTDNGKIYVEKAFFEFLSDNKMNFKLITEVDGQVVSGGNGVFTK